MPLHSSAAVLAFGLHHQLDPLNVIALSKIDYVRPFTQHAPITIQTQVIGDRSWKGKGTTHGTFQQIVSKEVVIPQQTRILSDIDAAFAFRFVMGKVVTSQHDALGSPATYDQTFTFKNVLSEGAEVAYASLLEQRGSGSTPGYKKLVTGAWFSQLTVRAALQNFPELLIQGGGRSYDDTTVTVPTTQSSAKLFEVARTTIKFQKWTNESTPLTPSSAASIDGKWVSCELTFNQNPSPKYRSGQPVGSEKFPVRADIGDQIVSGNIVIENEDVIRNYLLNENSVACEITFFGDPSDAVTADGDLVFLKITIPRIKLASESHGEEDDTEMLTLNIGEDSVLKNSSSEPVTVVLRSSISGAELGVISDFAEIQSVENTGADGPAYVTGEDIEVTITYDKAVTVTGTPQITMLLDATPIVLSYASGTGTTALVFSYTVQVGDSATAGQVSIAAQTIDLNGGTMVDALSDAVELAIAAADVGDLSAVTVN